MKNKMKTLFCAGILLFGWCAAEAAPEGVNLLKEPLEIRNPKRRLYGSEPG